MLIRWISVGWIFILICEVRSHSCGNNKIPYGIEVYKNGQPSLLCSKPTCFQKSYANCDEVALREVCPLNDTWIGGFNKGYGLHHPLYLQCCEFENLDKISDLVYSDVIIRPGEYFEGEEIMFTNHGKEKMASFDFISNLKMTKEGSKENQTIFRDYAQQCFNDCGILHPKSLFNNFFTGLQEYCITNYESIIKNWHCLQKMKKYRQLCDRECAGTCDKSCLYFCHHPVATRICEGPDPIGFLLNVSSVISPKSKKALNRDPLCYDEVTKYSRVRTRVN